VPPMKYRKYDSFAQTTFGDGDRAAALSRLRAACSCADWVEPLRPGHRDLLREALAELEGDAPQGVTPFVLTENACIEMASMDDADLPRYLVHRFRYDVFPQRRRLDDWPPYIQIEPTSICNLRCVFCFQSDPTFSGKKSGFMGTMDVGLFRDVIDQIAGNVEFASLEARGDPLAAASIEDMLACTRGKLLNLKLNTNAALLTERKCHAILQSGVRTVVFSADAADPVNYARMRVGAQLDKVLSNIERFRAIHQADYPDRPLITRVSGVKVGEEQSLDDMKALWGGLVDHVVFVAYNPWENAYAAADTNIADPCSDLWRRTFVFQNGTVNPCQVDYKGTLSVGRFPDRRLDDLWQSDAYQSLRARHLEAERGAITPCRGCAVV